MAGTRLMRPAAGAACAVAALAAAGCGGGSERQDADEPSGVQRLEVVGASFPARQSVAAPAVLKVRVRNAGRETAPGAAVTIRTEARQPGGTPAAFGQASDDPRLADPERPVWIVDRGPSAGGTAYGGTWVVGPLRAGESRELAWRVTPVEPGRFTVAYELSPGLDGRARLAPGLRASGSFRVRISDEPPESRVLDDGSVARTPAGSGR